ncbi:MAG: RNA 2',3'-cyclic phosphodiesterase [Candidatus Moranbacteria bacterium]|nr:RNA 2',3'-cyclic phosphodiesterase [Candidatus Moranbacteria bacterium]
METKKLFISVNFSAATKKVLQNCIETLKFQAKRGNFTKEDYLHLTLVFIGETNKEADIIKLMDTLDCPQFSLSLNKSGKFAHNRGDLYWLGIASNPDLLRLQSELTKKLQASGVAIENRQYRPHITLGRSVVADNPRIEVPEHEFLVDRIHLMQSLQQNGKLCYLSLYEKTFR